MTPSIYTTGDRKQVHLKYTEFTNEIRVTACDELGGIITHLIAFRDDKAVALNSAQQVLLKFGFDTSFCEWGPEGQMKLSLESE